MEDITEVMEQFVRDSRYTKLEKFKDANIELVTRFIVIYDTLEEARRNLQTEFTDAYNYVRPNSKRAPNLGVDIDTIYLEAKVRTLVLAKSWRLLSLGVEIVSAELIETDEDE